MPQLSRVENNKTKGKQQPADISLILKAFILCHYDCSSSYAWDAESDYNNIKRTYTTYKSYYSGFDDGKVHLKAMYARSYRFKLKEAA